MRHPALSYLMLTFSFFFLLMNSSLHQWAAEISTNQSKTILTAVEGFMCAALFPNVCVCVIEKERERDRERLHVQSTAFSPWPPDRVGLTQTVHMCLRVHVITVYQARESRPHLS